ncbi:MAG: methionine--tRNA ligase [bacterium]
MEKGFYVTTPIYYVNARPHLGHSYATVLADVIARYRRMRGADVWFLTGTDEHGQKLENAAREAGRDTKEFVDGIVKTFKDVWRTLMISNDDFIRTTEERHERVVQWIFERLYDKGDIYKGHYEGWYCTPCETFWSEGELPAGRLCPECGRETSRVKEESYFFRMSAYAGKLLDFYAANPGFIIPESRRAEVLNRVGKGLQDISVSRSTVRWGVPVPFDRGHTVYVWFDALINYLSALGFPDETGRYARFWPADVHVIGKDIIWFHGVIWPAMLLALGAPPPRHLCVTGFWLQGEDRMSKSRGNVTDPVEIGGMFGVDALRYFFLREMALGQDARFSAGALAARMNADLANDYGNLLHRTLNLVHKFTGGRVPDAAGDGEAHAALRKTAAAAAGLMDACQFKSGLECVWELVRSMNRYIDERKPWELARRDVPAMEKTLVTVLETVRSVAIMTSPVMPGTSGKIFDQLSLEWNGRKLRWDDALRWGAVQGRRVKKPEPVFPRADLSAL